MYRKITCVCVCVCLYFRNDGVMRTMTTDKLLKGMSTLQSQIDALLEFDVSVFRLSTLIHQFISYTLIINLRYNITTS